MGWRILFLFDGEHLPSRNTLWAASPCHLPCRMSVDGHPKLSQPLPLLPGMTSVGIAFQLTFIRRCVGVGLEGGFFNGASCWKSPKIPQHPFFLLVLIISKDFLGDREIFKIAQSSQCLCPSEGLSTLWLIPWLAFGDRPTEPFGLYFLPWQLCLLLKGHLFSYPRTSCHHLVDPLADSHCSWDKS